MYPLHISIDSFLQWLPTLPLGLGSMWPWGSAQQLMSSQTMHSGLDFPISSWWDSMHSLFLWTWSLGSLHTVYVFILTHKHPNTENSEICISVHTCCDSFVLFHSLSAVYTCSLVGSKQLSFIWHALPCFLPAEMVAVLRYSGLVHSVLYTVLYCLSKV